LKSAFAKKKFRIIVRAIVSVAKRLAELLQRDRNSPSTNPSAPARHVHRRRWSTDIAGALFRFDATERVATF
jgi:hypothetical protein